MDVLVTKELQLIQIVVNVVVGGTVCFFGIFFNIINMFVFWKQGLGQTVNISMFAISVSDLCSLVILAWMNINLNPFMENADIPYKPYDIAYITGSWPHYSFFQITIWITVYVTAERFVCIALPLKVKQIFTPFRTKIVIGIIYFLIILSVIPAYIYLEYAEVFHPARNQTRVVLKITEITVALGELTHSIYVVLEITSFVALTVFTCLLVVSLKRRLEKRKTLSADLEQCQVLPRSGTRSVKMVGLIAGVLIVCAAPGVMLSIAVLNLNLFASSNQFNETLKELWYFAYLTEAFTATMNTLLFYKMSSKYKQHFNDILCWCTARCHGYKTTHRGDA